MLSGASLDRLLFALGRLLASLGHFLGVSWALLGRSWLSLGCSVELHGGISAPRTVPCFDFGGFGDPQTEFGKDFNALLTCFLLPHISSHNA